MTFDLVGQTEELFGQLGAELVDTATAVERFRQLATQAILEKDSAFLERIANRLEQCGDAAPEVATHVLLELREEEVDV